MVSNEIKGKLERIFDLKVSFDEPGESNEQDTLFVEIIQNYTKVKDGRMTSRVEAQCSIYGPDDQIPIGFISKAIDRSEPVDRKDFFFFDLGQSSRLYQNIVQRSFSFIYFYSGQYDPEQGTITSTDINIEVIS